MMEMLIVFLFGIVVSSTSTKTDYCVENLFNSSLHSNYLQFTKELSSSEYGVKSSFKSLHCCAKGYRSIQWFKDGKPYPWASADLSTFVLYPAAANQTIFSQSLSTIDAGNYMCQIVNDSQTIEHTISLFVFDMSSDYTDKPLNTYEFPKEHYAEIGGTARMFCEAFIGRISLPDAYHEISWSCPGINSSQLLKNQRIHKKDVFREGEQILGSYFTISNVKETDFNEYRCSIRNSDDQVLYMETLLMELDLSSGKSGFNTPWLKILIIIVLLVLCIKLLSSVYQHIILSILLFFKNIGWKRNSDDGKLYDILVCYDTCDTDFIKTTLAVTLQEKYGYKVIYRQLKDPSLAETVSRSKSVLLIGSPGMCNNIWTPNSIFHLLEYMTSICNHIVFIPAKPIPDKAMLKSDDGKKLENILKKICVVNFVGNNHSDIRLFWIKLRLALPSIKRNGNQAPLIIQHELIEMSIEDQTTSDDGVKNKADILILTKSNESIEMLV